MLNSDQNPIDDYANAIAAIESRGSGGYAALGVPTKTGDQALGKYQVMASNVPAWTKQYLGTALTPSQFLASPMAQDAVFRGQFGSLVNQYGNPGDAASVWFTGKPMAEGANLKDANGTTGAQYVKNFNAALGNPSPTSPQSSGGIAAQNAINNTFNLGESPIPMMNHALAFLPMQQQQQQPSPTTIVPQQQPAQVQQPLSGADILAKYGITPSTPYVDPTPAGQAPVDNSDAGVLARYGIQPSQAATGAPQGQTVTPTWLDNLQRVPNAMANGIPIVGGLLNKADAATAATLAPLTNQILPTAYQTPGADWSSRYENSLARVNALDQQYAANHPIIAGASNIAGGVAGLLPAMAAAPEAFGMGAGRSFLANVGTGAFTNGLISAADAGVRGNDPGAGMAMGAFSGAGGAALGAVAPYVTAPLGKGVNALMNIAEPFLNSGQEAITNRALLERAAGGPMVANPSPIDGVVPTLAQATGNPNLAATERVISANNQNPFIERAQANAAVRQNLFNQIAGTPDTVAAMKATRNALMQEQSSNALQNAAPADATPVMKTINGILASSQGQRDAVSGALNNVAGKVVTGTTQLADGTEVPTLQNNADLLYGIRQHINDLLSPKASNPMPSAQAATAQLMAVKGSLDSVLAQAAPDFPAALSNFANASKPINAMEYLQSLKLNDANGNMTLPKVNQAVQGINGLLRAPGVNGAKSLSPTDLQTMNNLLADLRMKNNSSLGMGIGSPTYQNLATSNMLSKLGVLSMGADALSQGSLLKMGLAYGLRRATGGADQAMNEMLVNKLLNPNSLNDAIAAGGRNLPQPYVRNTFSPMGALIPMAASRQYGQQHQ